MTAVEAASLLVGAGIVAGIIGSGGGVTSLVSYPGLLAVGIPPLPASIANLVAGVVMGPGAALSSRPELAGTRGILLRLLPVSVLGTTVGSALLLVTPAPVFARVVPFLVVVGSLVLVLQPTLVRLTDRRHGRRQPFTVISVALISVYGGYFGAGSGVMLLAAILLFVDSRVPPANAIKNVLVGATSLVAATVFVISGPVPWAAVVPLAVGLLIGSLLGPIIVRHLPPDLVRWIAATLGFVLAGYLWVRPG